MTASHQFGRSDLPPEQEQALKKAVWWEYATIGYTIVTIALVALVVGNSQAMRTAWIEDMISLVPQIAFLVSLIFVRRRPTLKHPYGLHRAMGIGHLVAGLGWLMIAVMSIIVIGPFVYGHAKSKLAPVLHNKILFADADMAKADWHTNAASVVGVLGVGMGVWWLDGAAALFISRGIIWDGLRNTKGAVVDLMDQRARTYDDKRPHPLAHDIVEHLRAQPWISDAAVRVRDLGQVFHVEAFIVPRRRRVSVAKIDTLSERIAEMDWKVQDVVVIACEHLPEEADSGRGTTGKSG